MSHRSYKYFTFVIPFFVMGCQTLFKSKLLYTYEYTSAGGGLSLGKKETICLISSMREIVSAADLTIRSTYEPPFPWSENLSLKNYPEFINSHSIKSIFLYYRIQPLDFPASLTIVDGTKIENQFSVAQKPPSPEQLTSASQKMTEINRNLADRCNLKTAFTYRTYEHAQPF